MKEPIRVLMAEDDPNDAELVVRELRRSGFDPEWYRVDNEAAYTARLGGELDVVLSDYEMPQFNAPRALAILQEHRLEVPFIIISGTIGEDIAVEVMKQGASDYLLKDRLARLGPAVSRALKQSRLRRQAAEELRASEQRHRALIEALPVAVYTTDADGYLTLYNEAAATLWGLRPELGRARWMGALRLFTPDGAPLPHEESHMAVALRTGQPARDMEAILERPDGRRVAYLAYPTPLFDAAGRLTGAMNVMVDITARKQAEAAIQERLRLEEQLSRLVAAAPGIVYSFRQRADGTTCFPYASPQLEQLLGVRPEEVRENAAPAFALVHQDDRPQVEAAFRESARTLQPWTLVLRLQHPRRGLLWIESRSEPVREPDGSVLWHGFLLDVTGRKQLEEQLRQAQKMEAIGLLAGGVAHDFNNILTVIQGYATLLSQNVTDAAETAHEISHAVDRAAGLTRQLLLFSRKQPMRPRCMDLNEVIERVTRMLQRVLGEHITLETALEAGLPSIHGDAGMIEQILLNLAVNSRDAMPAGGRLQIATSAACVAESLASHDPEAATGPCVCLSVTDTGSGMAPEVLKRIFEPFFTTKEAGKGTGLGLATVYGIVKQHRGRLHVESAPGRGTSFRICLPASEAPPETPPAPASTSDLPSGTETVLVVEDEPALRTLAGHLLQLCGYTVLSAVSGAAALELWKQHRDRIDLVLTDMVMPDGVTGAQLAQRLCAERPGLKVLFTSGYGEEVASQGPPLVEGENFLQKPFQAHKLAQAVRRRLDRP